jgi:Fe-S oxidoreductase
MNQVFAPGCALSIYKPELVVRILDFLNEDGGGLGQHRICCRHDPNLPTGSRVINVCAGCDQRFRELYEGISTISLWEVLAERDNFPFPDYAGRTMTILDACPTRTETRVHEAVRVLLRKMNIQIAEPRNTRTSGICCGDSFYGVLPIDQVKAQMIKRAREMPREDVVVYCLSCVKAMHIGGKRPRHMADLLFGEATAPGTFEPDAWHAELQNYIDRH